MLEKFLISIGLKQPEYVEEIVSEEVNLNEDSSVIEDQTNEDKDLHLSLIHI